VENNNKGKSEEFNLRYEPNITEYKTNGSGQKYNAAFFEGQLGLTGMNFQSFWTVCKDSLYIMLYKKHPLFKDVPFPNLMLSACEETLNIWREYFKSHSGKYPRIDINKIIVSLDEFKDIAPFFETVTEISSLFYEKARSKGSITITGDKINNPLIQFKTGEKIEIPSFSKEHAKQLRKLLETTRNDFSLLVHEGKVYGIGEPDPDTILYTFNLTGHMEWNVLDHRGDAKTGVQVLRYKHGEYYSPIDTKIRYWYICSKINNNDAVCTMIDNLFGEEYTKRFDHGALIIITDEAEAEVNRLCKLRRGLQTEPTAITDDFKKFSTLCTIDGALFMDKAGRCYGIGIILDGEAKKDGNPARGSRYNSAKTYMSRCVDKKKEAYALVVSSDGYFDILTTNDEELTISDEKNLNKEECRQE
jgi:hypothetical protein